MVGKYVGIFFDVFHLLHLVVQQFYITVVNVFAAVIAKITVVQKFVKIFLNFRVGRFSSLLVHYYKIFLKSILPKSIMFVNFCCGPSHFRGEKIKILGIKRNKDFFF